MLFPAIACNNPSEIMNQTNFKSNYKQTTKNPVESHKGGLGRVVCTQPLAYPREVEKLFLKYPRLKKETNFKNDCGKFRNLEQIASF